MSKARAEEIDTDEENERISGYPEIDYAVDEHGRPLVQFLEPDFWNGRVNLDFEELYDEDDWS